MPREAFSVLDKGDQIINGNVYDFSSINVELSAGGPGFAMPGIFAISYDHALTPGEIRHVGPEVLAESVGTYTPRASFTLAQRDWFAFRTRLAEIDAHRALGFMQKQFNIVVTYAEEGEETVTDVLVKCRVMRVSRAYRNGPEPLAVDVELYLRRIVEGGHYAVLTPFDDVINAAARGEF